MTETEAVAACERIDARRAALVTIQLGVAQALRVISQDAGEVEWLIGVHEKCAHELVRTKKELGEACKVLDEARAYLEVK